MSVTRLGVNGTRPLVLLDLGVPEREALARILALAEVRLALHVHPADRRRQAESLIADLRKAAELPLVRDEEANDEH